MECKCTLENAQRDIGTGKWMLTLACDDMPIEDLRGDLRLNLKKWKNRRSLSANGLLWLMLGEMARELMSDKWEIYLQMLKRYGTYTYVLVPPKAVDALREQWRETEVVGEVDVHGKKAVQVLCYFGTSQMDTAEFSKFLDNVKSEMIEMGLQPPASEEMRRAIAQLEKDNAEHPTN